MTYFRLVKPKLLFAFLVINGLFAAVILVLWIILWLNGSFENSNESAMEVIAMGLGTCVAITLFILILGYYSERMRWVKKERALKQPPFKDLEQYGFVQSVFLTKSRWWFNDTAYVKLVRGYPVIINSFQGQSAEVMILVKPGYNLKVSDNSGFTVKKPGVSIDVPINTNKITSFTEIEKLIDSTVNQLIQLSVKPETSVSAYDAYLSGVRWEAALSQIG